MDSACLLVVLQTDSLSLMVQVKFYLITQWLLPLKLECVLTSLLEMALGFP